MNATKNMSLRRAWGALMGEAHVEKIQTAHAGIQSSTKWGRKRERRAVHGRIGYTVHSEVFLSNAETGQDASKDEGSAGRTGLATKVPGARHGK